MTIFIIKRRNLPSIIPLVSFLFLISTSAETSQEQPNEQPSSSKVPQNTATCPKHWVHINQKCYRFNTTPRNFEGAKSRCNDLFSRLAVIEDESMKERENSDGYQQAGQYQNIVSHIGDQKKSDAHQSKSYYVNLSPRLLEQHQLQTRQQNNTNFDGSNGDSFDHYDSELSISDLFLSRNDPSLANITLDNSSVFVLTYSKHYARWGLTPVSPTRKLFSICERNAEQTQPTPPTQVNNNSSPPNNNQHQSIQPNRRQSDSSGYPSSVSSPNFDGNQRASVGNYFEPTRVTPTTEKDSTTTPMPETTSMLFREFPRDHSTVLGSTAEIRCSPLESESILTWIFNGKNLTQSSSNTRGRVRIYANGTLRLEHVRPTDDGNYTCTIQSGGTSESKTARLEIIEKPHQPQYIIAELLDKVSTSVRVKWTAGFNGNSPITKYSVEMRTVNSDNVDSEMSLANQSNMWDIAKANISADQTSVIIPDLKPARKYIFRVRATNKVGTGDPSLPTRQSIEVPIQAPSMAPENLTGQPKSPYSIAIQWSPPPADSQNGVIKCYKIRHKLEGYTSETDWYTIDTPDAAHLSYVLDDLIVWQNYEIQIAAENDRGAGPFSPSIVVRTKEGRPDRSPQEVFAEPLSSTVIKVNWNPPPPNRINGVNQGYKVQVWLDNQHTNLTRELLVPHNTVSPFHTVTIDSLSPYTKYFITVKCYTNAGDGPSNEDLVSVMTNQDRPEAVSALEFADVLDKSLRVLWKPPRRINGELDHYTLEYSEIHSTDKKIVKNYPAGVIEARIVNLYPETSYTFKIIPHTKVGPGPGITNQTTTSVPPVLPEPPTSLFPTNIGSHSATIQFNPGFDGNASIEKWIVEASGPTISENGQEWKNVYTSTNHTQKDSLIVQNLKPYTRYRVRLKPVNIVGQSIHSSEPSPEFQTAQVEPEQPPRDLTIKEVKSNSVVLHWVPLSYQFWHGQSIGYNLTWSEVNNSSTMYYLINETKADSAIIRELEEFTEYIFKIYSVNQAGMSLPSEPVHVTTLEDAPSSGPTNLTAHAISSNAISVDWNTIPKRHRNGIIKGYKIQYQAPESPVLLKTVEDNSTRHVTLNDLKAYTNYRLAVAAYTSAGDGVYSTVLNVQTLEDTPGTPQNLSSPTVSQTTARILWDPPENPNGDVIGYKVTYQTLSDNNNKEVASHELQHNERTFKATNLKPETHYVFTVTAKTKEGWGQQASMLLYTYDSELRANLPFYRESWFVILCACSSVVITILITALLFVQTKSYKYKQDAIKSTSQDRLGDAGFSIDDDGSHYNNGFGLLPNAAHHRRSNGALSQSTANFTLPKSPPRPHPGSVVYSDDEGDDDVFEDEAGKPSIRSTMKSSVYDSSGDSVTEKPSELSSSTPPESVSGDEEYVNTADRRFVNHYANVNGTLRGQKAWRKPTKQYASHRMKPKLPQRPVPSVPQVPGEPSSSSSDNASHPRPGTSGSQSNRPSNSIYGEHSCVTSRGSPPNKSTQQPHQLQQQQSHQIPQQPHTQSQPLPQPNNHTITSNGHQFSNGTSSESPKNQDQNNNQNTQTDLLNSQIINLNGGRIIVDNMAGSRAPLPGFTSFV